MLTGNAAAAAAAAACELAATVFQVHPFSPDELPDRWPELVTAWLSGAAIGSVVRDGSAAEVEFIQQGLVYRLVWAMEAVRVHALAVGEPDANNLSGAAAFALTYGAPTVQAAMLIEAGLSSRAMAVELTRALPSEFSDATGFYELLLDVIERVR